MGRARPSISLTSGIVHHRVFVRLAIVAPIIDVDYLLGPGVPVGFASEIATLTGAILRGIFDEHLVLVLGAIGAGVYGEIPIAHLEVEGTSFFSFPLTTVSGIVTCRSKYGRFAGPCLTHWLWVCRF